MHRNAMILILLVVALCSCASTREETAPSIVEFRAGKISRSSDYWDLATYLRQVGLAK